MGKIQNIILTIFFVLAAGVCLSLIYTSVVSIKNSVSTINQGLGINLAPEIVEKIEITGQCSGSECISFCLNEENMAECEQWCEDNPEDCMEVVSKIGGMVVLETPEETE